MPILGTGGGGGGRPRCRNNRSLSSYCLRKLTQTYQLSSSSSSQTLSVLSFYAFSRSLLCPYSHQRYLHALAQHFLPTPLPQGGPTSDVADAKVATSVDTRRWKKLDSRTLGIEHGVIPHGPWTVMNILRREGFDAYLVGGCVRDLLLKKTPKDFDVITNASLNQIRKQFHRAVVVGQRFPICMVHIRDSVTEVSSFETVAKQAERKGEEHFSEVPHGCEMNDFIRWRNSLKRDFTINSLFFDPFSNKVYDYSRGISDLRSLKLRTIIPAKVSFEEDCARILRGLRIAARLGLSFSKDTESALRKLSQSITRLPKARIFMELNYMLSYGAAEPSIYLLHKFNVLDILLPFHAAYLEQPDGISGQNTRMLMKLFSNLDKVVRCDHPSDCRLWVGLLAFHLALVNNPQDAFVVMTLASILYHGGWKEGIRYARENAEVQVHFKPELSSSFTTNSHEELAEEVSRLAAFVQASVDILTEPQCLLESMSRYPTSLSSGSVFIPRRIGQDVAELFQLPLKQDPAYEKRRESFDVDYNLLGKGYMWETRFVLGKIILETMGCTTLLREGETIEEGTNEADEKVIDENCNTELSNLLNEHLLFKKLSKLGVSLTGTGVQQKSDTESKFDTTLEKGEMVERKICQEITEKYQNVDETDGSAKEGLHLMIKNVWARTELLEVMEKKKSQKDIRVDETDGSAKEGLLSVQKDVWLRTELLAVMDKKKGDSEKMHQSEDEKPDMENKCELRDEDIMERKSKDERPLVDDGFESLGEIVKEKKGDVKKQQCRSTEKSRELLVGEVKEKKKGEDKKQQHRSTDKRRETLDGKVIDEKKGDSKTKQRRSTDKRRESLDREVILEEKKGDAKKQCKSKGKRPSLEKRRESLDGEAEEKKGDAKKQRKSKGKGPSSDKRCESPDEAKTEEKKGDAKKQRKSKDQRPATVNEDEEADYQGFARKNMDEVEGKQVAGNEDQSRSLLSSLFK